MKTTPLPSSSSLPSFVQTVYSAMLSRHRLTVSVDTLEDLLGAPRQDIIAALRCLEEEKLGVFVIGRRGAKSRFLRVRRGVATAASAPPPADLSPSEFLRLLAETLHQVRLKSLAV